MNVVFTLCSANYLAHAKTLGDSVREHNPDAHFVIGLVDRMPKELEPSYLQSFEVVPVEDLQLPQFGEMAQKYNIVELNTAVKPFYMAFLFERDPRVDAVIYLDPDIMVCGSFNALLDKLKTCSIVITPHSCTYDDSAANIYFEKAMLSFGVYNLGFIASRRSSEASAFLKWWKIR
ncbi:MAG TPA: glycosyltransferase, partial [Candidatus Cybelea sp.]|nr:glycosyltransferase [Candidatus Cybelea sp.]